MSFIKNSFLTLILNLTVFCSFSFSQESYLIKKKITEDASVAPSDNLKNEPSTDLKQKDRIKKDKKEENIKKEKNVLKNKDDTFNKAEEKIDKASENSLTLKDNKFHIIYKPNQISLSQEDVIKVIEISSSFNRENVLTIKSYASKNFNKGSSEARRTSLSRALEIRSLLIENEFPATNILVRALGSEENNEGFTDVIIIEVN